MLDLISTFLWTWTRKLTVLTDRLSAHTKKETKMTTNWLDPKSAITDHFTVKEACWLPTWGKLYAPTLKEQEALQQTCALMEKVRTLLGKHIYIHCMIRPRDYNKLIGGAPQSAHIFGLACDFGVPGMDCDAVRALLLPKLDEWKARLENKPGSNWVHLDLYAAQDGRRYFKP